MPRWQVELSDGARRDLRKISKPDRDRILAFFEHRLQALDHPRAIGQALKGSRFGDFWRYRVGDYRIITRLEDDVLVILVVTIGHRKEVYD